MKIYFVLVALVSLVWGQNAMAQELAPDSRTTAKAAVLEILDSGQREITGTGTNAPFQDLRVKILEGEQAGEVVTVENDHLDLEVGDVFFLLHTVSRFDGMEYYSVLDPYRLPAVLFFVFLFLAVVVIFGGWQGMRGLLSLAISFFFIFFLLFPGILAGYSPVLVSILVASLIIILGSYITHGFNKTTTAAVVGMILTVILTGVLSYLAVVWSQLSGFHSDESVYLNFNTGGSIDFIGLLLGGILIGLLGVLYDAAIGQAIAVEELRRAGPHLSHWFIYKRAIRMGREHIGALVNTLAIAYVGISMPLLLLFYTTESDLMLTLNREVFATEIIRTMLGSIGLVLAVPVTTLVATFMVARLAARPDEAVLLAEKEATLHIGHHH